VTDGDNRMASLRIDRFDPINNSFRGRTVKGFGECHRDQDGTAGVKLTNDILNRDRACAVVAIEQLADRTRRFPRIDVRDRSFDIRPLGFRRLPVQFDRLEHPAKLRAIIRVPAVTLQCTIVSPFRGKGLPARPHRGVCVAGGEGKAGRSWILIPRWPEISTQVDEACDHSLGRLEHLLEFGLPHARALGTSQVVAKQQFVKRCVRHPRPRFLKQNLTLRAVF